MPLETLSGWPPAENPTVLQTLVLLVGFPILVFLIVIAINKIVQTIHATRGDDPRTSDPLYMVDARTGEARLVEAMQTANRRFYGACGCEPGDRRRATGFGG